MKVAILGGGLAGISLAYFLQKKEAISEIVIFEQEAELGGLCRSFLHQGLYVDIGPHIFFSKDQEVLLFMLSIMGENQHRLRRSNRIIHKKCLVQYPFENDLSKLPKEDTDRCLNGFLNNPYRDYPAHDMLQFFFKIFGEGITNLYLRPYNEKIWKFTPAFMDTQMVERIPRPPDEDIIRSAKGATLDGYLHQLYFHYPISGGTRAFIQAFAELLKEKVRIRFKEKVNEVQVGKVLTDCGEYTADRIISCIPPQEIADDEIRFVVDKLRYNSIIIATATVNVDRAGDNFAFMVADPDIIFHRISKIDFLGENYHCPGTATYMMEYTYRQDDQKAFLPDDLLKPAFLDGLRKIGFIEKQDEVVTFTLKRFPYAYVIYDLHHKKNMDMVRNYFSRKGILLNGRFGNFEYWNMDRVIRESKKLAEMLV